MAIDDLLDAADARPGSTQDLAKAVAKADSQGTELIFTRSTTREGQPLQSLPQIAPPVTSLQTDPILAQGEGNQIPLFWTTEQDVPLAAGLASGFMRWRQFCYPFCCQLVCTGHISCLALI